MCSKVKMYLRLSPVMAKKCSSSTVPPTVRIGPARWLASGDKQSIQGKGSAEFQITLRQPWRQSTSLSEVVRFGKVGCLRDLNYYLVQLDPSRALNGWYVPRSCSVGVGGVRFPGDWIPSTIRGQIESDGLIAWRLNMDNVSVATAREEIRKISVEKLPGGVERVSVGKIPTNSAMTATTLTDSLWVAILSIDSNRRLYGQA